MEYNVILIAIIKHLFVDIWFILHALVCTIQFICDEMLFFIPHLITLLLYIYRTMLNPIDANIKQFKKV